MGSKLSSKPRRRDTSGPIGRLAVPGLLHAASRAVSPREIRAQRSSVAPSPSGPPATGPRSYVVPSRALARRPPEASWREPAERCTVPRARPPAGAPAPHRPVPRSSPRRPFRHVATPRALASSTRFAHRPTCASARIGPSTCLCPFRRRGAPPTIRPAIRTPCSIRYFAGVRARQHSAAFGATRAGTDGAADWRARRRKDAVCLFRAPYLRCGGCFGWPACMGCLTGGFRVAPERANDARVARPLGLHTCAHALSPATLSHPYRLGARWGGLLLLLLLLLLVVVVVVLRGCVSGGRCSSMLGPRRRA
jgi:hypothetical protein